MKNGAKALNLNTLKTTAFEYINNITINQVICDFPLAYPLSEFLFFILHQSFIEFFLHFTIEISPFDNIQNRLSSVVLFD